MSRTCRPFAIALFLVATGGALAAQQRKPAATPGAEGVTADTTPTQAPSETPAQRDARTRWWREAKFGLFIHWGVYAVPAGKYGDKDTYGEWIMLHRL
jgi:alpha-L-fucosidase